MAEVLVHSIWQLKLVHISFKDRIRSKSRNKHTIDTRYSGTCHSAIQGISCYYSPVNIGIYGQQNESDYITTCEAAYQKGKHAFFKKI